MTDPTTLLNAVAGFFRGYGSIDQLWPELQRFFATATDRWAAMLVLGLKCGHQRCERPAVNQCVTCGRTVCFRHAYTNMEADAVCHGCVQVKVKARPRPQRKQRAVKKRSELADAYRVLGLSEGASFARVQERFRELARTEHPDKAPPRERARAEARFKKITAAYHYIEAHRRAA